MSSAPIAHYGCGILQALHSSKPKLAINSDKSFSSNAEMLMGPVGFPVVENGVAKVVKKLKKQTLPPVLQEIIESTSLSEFVRVRQAGKISDQEYQKFGPAMILKYVMEIERAGEEKVLKHERSGKRIDNVTVGFLTQRYRDNLLPLVKWDSAVVNGLLNAVKCASPPPKIIKSSDPEIKTTPTPWLDTDEMLGILKSGLDSQESRD